MSLTLHAPAAGYTEPANVGDVVDLYLADAKNKLSERSFEGRKAVLDDFAASYGNVALADAKPFHVQLWLNAHPAWKSNHTKRGAIAGVGAAFNWGVKLGLIAKNPFAGISCPPGERGDCIELEEYRAILRHTPPHFRRFVRALRWTGARPGEIAKATWADVDFERAIIQLDLHKTKKATGEPRTIVLHPILLKLVRALRRRDPSSDGLLFPNSHGRAWTQPAISWYLRLLRDAGHIGPATTLYSLRHLLITELVINGENLAIVAQIAGHKRIATTMNYIHLANKVAPLQSALARVFRKH